MRAKTVHRSGSIVPSGSNDAEVAVNARVRCMKCDHEWEVKPEADGYGMRRTILGACPKCAHMYTEILKVWL